MSNTLTAVASVADVCSDDLNTDIVAWEDGTLSIYQNQDPKTGEAQEFVHLDRATLRDLAVLLQSSEMQTLISQAISV